MPEPTRSSPTPRDAPPHAQHTLRENDWPTSGGRQRPDSGEWVDRPRATFTFPGLNRILPVILQHWKLIFLCTLLGLASAIAALPLMETRYLGTAKVLVQFGREMTAPPTATAKEVVSQFVTSKRPEDLGSEIEIMKSPQLIEEVVLAFGTDYFLAEPPAVTLWQQTKQLVRHTIRYVRETVHEGLILLGVRRRMNPVERVVAALQQALSVEDIRKSDVISVQMRAGSPEIAVAVLRKYLELFQEKHIATYRSPGNREFFEAESTRSLRQLHETEVKLARYKDENKVWLITEQSSLLLKTQRELIDAIARTSREMIELQNRIVELERQEVSLPSEVKLSNVTTYDPVNDEMRKERAKLEAQMAHTAVLFGERSPQILQLQRQLDMVNNGISGRQSIRGDQATTGLNQLLFNVRRDIGAARTQFAGLQARAATEATQLDDVEKSIRKLSATETTLYDMQREVTRLEREYQLYTAKLEDSRVSEAMDLANISNVRVISAPAANLVPVFPPLLMVLVGGTAVGLCGSLAFVFLRDAIHPVVRTKHDVENIFGVQVLANLPEHRTLR